AYSAPLSWHVFGADDGYVQGVVHQFQSVENLTSGTGGVVFFVDPARAARGAIDGIDPTHTPRAQVRSLGPGQRLPATAHERGSGESIPAATPDSGSINPPWFGGIQYKGFEHQGVVVTAGQLANDRSVDRFLAKTDGSNVKVFLNNGLLPVAIIPLSSTAGL